MTYTHPWRDKKVLITGVCGTVGQELLRQVVSQEPAEVIGLDNNESDLFFLSDIYRDHPHVRFFLGDVRDRDNLTHKMRDMQIVLHSAALKHVILCEESPREAVQTNILGIQNIIDAATVNNVERVCSLHQIKRSTPRM